MSQNVDEATSIEKQESHIADKVSQIDLCEIDDQLKAGADDDGFEETPKQLGLLHKFLGKGLVENKNDIEIQGGNPNLPLQSVKSFEDLNLKPNLLKGVHEMGFKTPSKIQETVLPILLADPPQDVLVQSQSGTGKRTAFVLAMLSRVNPDLKYPQVLCLSHTYELGIQIGEIAAHMAKFCPEIEIKYAVREEKIKGNTKITQHVVIGTPERVLDWGFKFEVLDLNQISVFVLDEADVLLATRGHHYQCIRIHEMISQECQMMFFSTTYEQEVMNFAEIIDSNPLIIRLEREEKSLDIDLRKSDDQLKTDADDGGSRETPKQLSLLHRLLGKGLVENKNDIQVQGENPNLPMQSVKSFEDLDLKPNLLKGVYEMGFKAPSKIQETVLPILLADPPQNVIVQSQFGTGKTVAFVLAMLNRVNSNLKYPHVLCLSPTSTLVTRIRNIAAEMAKYCTEIEIVECGDDGFGGNRWIEFHRPLERHFMINTKITKHVVIATPGVLVRRPFDFDLSKITVLILDEADVIAGPYSQYLSKVLSKNCQTMFFSTSCKPKIINFAKIIDPKPLIISLKFEGKSLDNIKQYYVVCPNVNQKYNAMTKIYGTVGVGQVIVFCNTSATVNWLEEKMMENDYDVVVLTEESSAKERAKVSLNFRQAYKKVLIATDTLLRGIDVGQATIVVNFDLPVDTEGRADYQTYRDRIGRTGFLGKDGIAINLVDSTESMQSCQDIEKHFKCKISYRTLKRK